ncbi:MAG TPA: hypothetical protein VLA98_10345, partial [Solirubrobacteraceae bacterium]|nr:hypothetical protein [Solirubrobacteraceae bacterium]
IAALLAVAAASAGAGGHSHPAAAAPQRASFDPSGFRARVDHPLVPLARVRVTVLEGHERGDTGAIVATRTVARVRHRTATVAGVRSTVVAVRDYEDGELVEATRDFYAQRRGGTVLYMGEDVDDYERGRVVGHGGQWRAGTHGAKAGIFMPARPRLGQAFAQERAPGVAEDHSKIVAVGRTVTTPAGRFTGCVRTRDVSPLDRKAEFKFYCPGVGLVREDVEGGRAVLVRYR